MSRTILIIRGMISLDELLQILGHAGDTRLLGFGSRWNLDLFNPQMSFFSGFKRRRQYRPAPSIGQEGRGKNKLSSRRRNVASEFAFSVVSWYQLFIFHNLVLERKKRSPWCWFDWLPGAEWLPSKVLPLFSSQILTMLSSQINQFRF